MSLLPFRMSHKRKFEELVGPHLEAMYRFAFRLTGQQQDSEDLVQDILIKLYPRLDEISSVERLRPWLNRVLYRQFVDSLRRQGRRADIPLSSLEVVDEAAWLENQCADVPGIPEQLDMSKLGLVLDQALFTLSPDQRTLILLHDVDGWSQEDLASVLGVPLGTVKSRIHRCRAALRKKLQETPDLSRNFLGNPDV
ncbi:RNA polymerase sigma factor [Marinobacter sp. CHS3-4]|uniref:RNA polymerase sigma factor n=1 Tax=Marinobacter sp. CHS3-4 TaxID=3045174 RepID=UPI0024B588E9|nr:RNA polymerase sigma factor [Marinobacter sp. CHS3-4]MDI9246596.1 RNA polymerase sigma factor [Marinobacter sp. CHS3-4]